MFHVKHIQRTICHTALLWNMSYRRVGVHARNENRVHSHLLQSTASPWQVQTMRSAAKWVA
jgi:hypothetical protein